jgi:hypothetical protein
VVAGGGEVVVAHPSELQAGLITEARVRGSHEENARLDKALQVADVRKHEQAMRDAMSETEAGALGPLTPLIDKVIDKVKDWFDHDPEPDKGDEEDKNEDKGEDGSRS